VRATNTPNVANEILKGLGEIKKEIGEVSVKINEMEKVIGEMYKFKEEVKSVIEMNAKKSFFLCLDIVKVAFPHVFSQESSGYEDKVNQLASLYNNKYKLGQMNSVEFFKKFNNNDNTNEMSVGNNTSINVQQATQNVQPTLTQVAAGLGTSAGGLCNPKKPVFNINNGTRTNSNQQIVKNGEITLVIPKKT
jgi:hypothetical protein